MELHRTTAPTRSPAPSAIALLATLRRERTREVTVQDLRAALSMDEVSVREQERARIAGRLHDDVLPLLAALRQDTVEGRPHLELEQAVLAVVAQTRRLIGEEHPAIAPPPPDLQSAVLEMTSTVCARAGLTLTVAIDLGGNPPDRRHSQLMLAAVRELVANAAHHAHADNVEVRGRRDGAAWTLTVSDDGCGFDVDEHRRHPRPGHLGHARLRQDLERAGGRLHVFSSRAGTTVAIRFPASGESRQGA